MTVEQARLDRLLIETYGRVPKRRIKPKEPKPFRLCSRCGIRTHRADKCVDCTEVTR